MITLYHGSYLSISSPFVKIDRKKVDFGQGFYLTKSVNHQICILNQEIVDLFLHYQRSEELNLEEDI